MTDRPDFVESSLTVGPGRFQIETSLGVERSTDQGARMRALVAPTLLRLGVARNWELRLETDTFTSVSGAGRTTSGRTDIALGAKLHTQDGSAGRPSVGWLFHVDLPTGTGPFRGTNLRPSVRSAVEWDLPGDVSVGLMPGLLYDDTPETGRFVSGILAATVSKGWTERFRTFAELSGQALRTRRNGGDVVTFDTGLTYLLRPNLQLDAAGFWGLTAATPRLFLMTGISLRF